MLARIGSLQIVKRRSNFRSLSRTAGQRSQTAAIQSREHSEHNLDKTSSFDKLFPKDPDELELYYNGKQWRDTKNLWEEMGDNKQKFAGKKAKADSIIAPSPMETLTFPSIQPDIKVVKQPLSTAHLDTLQGIYRKLLEGEQFEYQHDVKDVSQFQVFVIRCLVQVSE